MRVIAFMNQKGGVGKTTTAVNVGSALAEMGARVLCLDLDSQTNLTTYLGVDPESGERVDMFDVLCGEASFSRGLLQVDRTMAVVPGSRDLAAAEIELSGRPDRVVVLRNKMATAVAGGAMPFDYVLIDCPPSLGLLTLNALAVAGEVVIPMQAHFLAMQGFAKLLETCAAVQKQINPRLRISGVVLTMFDGQAKLSGEVVAELERFLEGSRGANQPWSDARLFRTRVRRNIKVTESPSFGQSVLAYDSASNGAADYRALAREVATMRYGLGPLDRANAQQPLPTPKSLVERAMEDVEGGGLAVGAGGEKPQAAAVTPVGRDATKLAAARVGGGIVRPASGETSREPTAVSKGATE